jgi:hypothetical protein
MLARTRGLVMTSAFDQADSTSQGNDLANLRAASSLPPMTPEMARQLAAILAPHLTSMRAVTAGTPYEDCDPASRIFVAGMLDRLSA